MNKSQIQAIQNITKTPDWAVVEEVLREQLVEMADLRNLNLEENIDEQVFGRIEAIKAIVKFLRKIGMLSRDPIKFNPKNFI